MRIVVTIDLDPLASDPEALTHSMQKRATKGNSSAWLVETPKTPIQLRAELGPLLNSSDEVFVGCPTPAPPAVQLTLGF